MDQMAFTGVCRTITYLTFTQHNCYYNIVQSSGYSTWTCSCFVKEVELYIVLHNVTYMYVITVYTCSIHVLVFIYQQCFSCQVHVVLILMVDRQ